MKLNIPRKFGEDQPQCIEIEKSLVIIGANGSGKTRFGAQIEKGFPKEIHRISAQKSLLLPEATQTSTIEHAEFDFFYGTYSNIWDEETHIANSETHKWKGNSSIQPLDDFSKLMRLLFTYELDNAINENPSNVKNPLTTIKNVWERVITNKKLKIEAGLIRTISHNSDNKAYNASQMSDGERVIFYLIGQVACAKNDAIIIIDEPEMHLHKSISTTLWNEIEEIRPDCKFIYLTHDLEIAVSRKKSKIIWLKEYHDKDLFDYQCIPDDDHIPDQLYLELLGSRQPVLFIEGDLKSIDFRLYSKIFKNFTVKPVGPCSKVDEHYKSFKRQISFHNIESFGLVDRDRRNDDDIAKYRNTGILITEVSESENLLLLENIVRAIARFKSLDEELIFNKVKLFVLSQLTKDRQSECLEYTVYKLDEKSSRYIKKSNNLESLEKSLEDFKNGIDARSLYADCDKIIGEILDNKDYAMALKIYKNKTLISLPAFYDLFNLNHKSDYANLCISILEDQSNESFTIREEIIKHIINYPNSSSTN